MTKCAVRVRIYQALVMRGRIACSARQNGNMRPVVAQTHPTIGVLESTTTKQIMASTSVRLVGLGPTKTTDGITRLQSARSLLMPLDSMICQATSFSG